jgi:hypothetical protein
MGYRAYFCRINATDALNHFSRPKQQVITTFLDSIFETHGQRGRMYVGEYSYDETMDYRVATDNPWIETTMKLTDLATDPERIEKYQRCGLLAQHIDDMLDCVVDAKAGSQNLFLGLAWDMASEHPEELAALKRFIDTPEDRRPDQSVKSWIRNNMPHIRAAYADKYHGILTQLHGPTRTLFWGAGKKL